MPIYNRGACACCQSKTIVECATYSSDIEYTHKPTYSSELDGVTYYYFYPPYSGELEPNGYVTFRIKYSDNTMQYVNVPISSSDIGYDGLNTLEINALTFDADGYRFTCSGTFRVGCSYWLGGSDTTCTHTFDYIADSTGTTWVPINQ